MPGSEDDREEIPDTVFDAEFDRAEQMLDDATTALDVDISKATIVNRLYYACFHATQAVLYSRGFNPTSHGRVQTLLGQELILGGRVDSDHGRFFNDMETYRRRLDYGSGGFERDVEELLDGTRQFLAAMREATGDDAGGDSG